MSGDGTSQDGHEAEASVVPPTLVTETLTKALFNTWGIRTQTLVKWPAFLGQIASTKQFGRQIASTKRKTTGREKIEKNCR